MVRLHGFARALFPSAGFFAARRMIADEEGIASIFSIVLDRSLNLQWLVCKLPNQFQLMKSDWAGIRGGP
jgi:hypothetical protein